MNWEIDTQLLKLKQPWKIAGAEVTEKKIYLVKFKNGKHSGMGEIAYSSKEQMDMGMLQNDLEHFSFLFKDNNVIQFQDLTRLLDTIDFHTEQMRFAIESAFLDYLSRACDMTKWRILGTNTVNSLPSVNSLPLFEDSKLGQKLYNELENKPEILKVKVSKETFHGQVEFLNNLDQKFVLDGNESWGNDVSRFISDIDKIKNSNLIFVEQPLEKYCVEGYKELKKKNIVKIFLDESIMDHKHINTFLELCDGIVLKSAKSRSIPRILSQLTQARNLGLKTMLGCMVESSIGISSLFPVAYGFDYYDLDGFLKFEKDPYRLVYWDNGRVVLSEMN